MEGLMPYVVKEAKRLAEVALDLPNPPRQLHLALDDLLRVMNHPLAVPAETFEPRLTLAEQLMEIE